MTRRVAKAPESVRALIALEPKCVTCGGNGDWDEKSERCPMCGGAVTLLAVIAPAPLCPEPGNCAAGGKCGEDGAPEPSVPEKSERCAHTDNTYLLHTVPPVWRCQGCGETFPRDPNAYCTR